MRRLGVFTVIVLLVGSAQSSWYWPFGSDDAVDERPKRVSELIEPASLLIEEAADLAGEGKANEAIEKYRKALAELDRIELENPDRAKSVEFSTLRNKRAYVNAAIDSLLLNQVKANAKLVAVSDTTELERRLTQERAEKTGKRNPKSETSGKTEESVPKVEKPVTVRKDRKEQKSASTNLVKTARRSRPLTKREQALTAIAKGDFKTAERLVGEMLVEKPNGAVALNLKAAMEVRQGKLKEAESTLDQAIMSNPRNHFAYYNMANLMLQVRKDDKSIARRYYETGRAFGGPDDAQLEAALK